MELTESGFGMELIETEAIKILYNELNTELQAVQERWEERDIQINQLIGIEPVTVEQEFVVEGNYYLGNNPSLITSPIDKYPNVCAICDSAEQSDNEYDQFNNYDCVLAIEIMCKSLYNESEVNRRAQRMLEAVHNVMMRNSTLNGIIEGFNSDPAAALTDVFTRSDHPQGESDWYWRAGRIEYTISRHAIIPE
jgi:hypothetical protein